jgi:hypothetical protein
LGWQQSGNTGTSINSSRGVQYIIRRHIESLKIFFTDKLLIQNFTLNKMVTGDYPCFVIVLTMFYQSLKTVHQSKTGSDVFRK